MLPGNKISGKNSNHCFWTLLFLIHFIFISLKTWVYKWEANGVLLTGFLCCNLAHCSVANVILPFPMQQMWGREISVVVLNIISKCGFTMWLNNRVMRAVSWALLLNSLHSWKWKKMCWIVMYAYSKRGNRVAVL